MRWYAAATSRPWLQPAGRAAAKRCAGLTLIFSSQVDDRLRRLICEVCKNRNPDQAKAGIKVQCKWGRCAKAFHPTCALKAGCFCPWDHVNTTSHASRCEGSLASVQQQCLLITSAQLRSHDGRTRRPEVAWSSCIWQEGEPAIFCPAHSKQAKKELQLTEERQEAEKERQKGRLESGKRRRGS